MQEDAFMRAILSPYVFFALGVLVCGVVEMRLDYPKSGEVGKCVLRRPRLFRTSKRHFPDKYASECLGILPVRRYFRWDFMLLATELADKRPSIRVFHDANYSTDAQIHSDGGVSVQNARNRGARDANVIREIVDGVMPKKLKN